MQPETVHPAAGVQNLTWGTVVYTWLFLLCSQRVRSSQFWGKTQLEMFKYSLFPFSLYYFSVCFFVSIVSALDFPCQFSTCICTVYSHFMAFMHNLWGRLYSQYTSFIGIILIYWHQNNTERRCTFYGANLKEGSRNNGEKRKDRSCDLRQGEVEMKPGFSDKSSRDEKTEMIPKHCLATEDPLCQQAGSWHGTKGEERNNNLMRTEHWMGCHPRAMRYLREGRRTSNLIVYCYLI